MRPKQLREYSQSKRELGLLKKIELREQQLKIYDNKFQSISVLLKSKDKHITELEKGIEIFKQKIGGDEKKKIHCNHLVIPDNNVMERTNVQKVCDYENLDFGSEETKQDFKKHEKLLDDNLKMDIEAQEEFINQIFKKEIQSKICKVAQIETEFNLSIENETFSEDIISLKEKLIISAKKSKKLEKTIEELTQQLCNTPERENETRTINMKAEYVKLKQDYEISETCRNEMRNILITLITRLEELAYFLDSLLKHKSVLGILGIKQQSLIKNVIDQSLDLSKLFNMNALNEDNSLLQLSSISSFLNTSQDSSLNISMFGSNIETKKSLLYNENNNTSYNNTSTQIKEIKIPLDFIIKQNEVINSLKHQIKLLNNKNMTYGVDINSFLQQTQETKNIHVDLLNISPIMYFKTQGNNFPIETCNSKSSSETDSKIFQARIGTNTESLNTVSETKSTLCIDKLCSVKKENDDSNLIDTLQNNIIVLEKELKTKNDELSTLPHILMKNENKFKEQELKNLNAVLRTQQKEKMDLEIILEEKIKIIGTLENTCVEMKFEKEDNRAKIENLLSLIKDNELQINILENILKESEQKWKTKMKAIELDNDIKVQELKSVRNELNELKTKYESEWIQKSEVDKKIEEKISQVNIEFKKCKKLLLEAETKEKQFKQTEMILNEKLRERECVNREEVITLKRELNEYALRTSEAVLERTKLNNKKLELELEIRRFTRKDNEKSMEFIKKEKEFNSIQNILQSQLSQIELQKTNLQLKISELEAVNVELSNRIIRLESCHTNQQRPKSAPVSPKKLNAFPKTSHQYAKYSLNTYKNMSYSNQEYSNIKLNSSAPELYHRLDFINQNISHDDRYTANLSVNLGIESDTGKLSSLKPYAGRPLFQTLELTASMNNLLSDDYSTSGQHCNIIGHRNLLKDNDHLQKTNSKLASNLAKARHQLLLINKTKKEVEKAVCKQITKTSNVLHHAKINLL